MFTITSSEIVPQGISETSTEKLVELGTIVSAIDSSNNIVNEYIYALGLAGTVVGTDVYIDETVFASEAATGSGTGIRAEAMSANIAAQYGWYKIKPIIGGVYTTNIGLALTKSYDNIIVVLSNAAGQAVTVPAATGSGNKFTVIVGETVTSGSITITAPGGSSYHGGTSIRSAADNTASSFEATGTTITLDGTTTGGGRGDKFEIIDIAAGIYSVQGLQNGSGTLATPFS